MTVSKDTGDKNPVVKLNRINKRDLNESSESEVDEDEMQVEVKDPMANLKDLVASDESSEDEKRKKRRKRSQIASSDEE